MNIEFDPSGYPTFCSFSNAIVISLPAPVVSAKSGVEPQVKGKYKYYEWGTGDNFPTSAINTIEDVKGNTALNRTLNILLDVYCGQGILPVRVTGMDQTGEIVEVVQELIPVLAKPWVRKYIVKTFRDILKLGNAFVQVRPTAGKKIGKLSTGNGRYYRLEETDSLNPKNILIGTFPEVKEEDIQSFPLLPESDPEDYLEDYMKKGSSFYIHLKDEFSNAPFYAIPNWVTAQTWIGISNKLAIMIDKGLDNLMNISFLIRIPYSYWKIKYPEDIFTNKQARMELISADIAQLEINLTTVENARKAMVTLFGENKEKPEADKWELESISNKHPTDILQNASGADAQVIIGAGGHPDILGLMFGNSKGGSMQREILLLLYALSWRKRQLILDPLEMMIRYNEPKYDDVELRFVNTFLTTLDTGGGTGRVLS